MKKKTKLILITIIVLLILILAGGIAVFLFTRNTAPKRPAELGFTDKRIIISYDYINFAWGFVYKGKALASDGTIYDYELNEDIYDKSLLAISDYIIKNGTETGKMPPEDLTEVIYNIANLTDKYHEEHFAMDAGFYGIREWNYDTDNYICLEETGDFQGENNTKEAKILRKIIKQYMGRE